MTADDDRPTPGNRPDIDAPVAETTVDADGDRVWRVVIDPETYPDWLIGAQRIRATDSEWPQPGSAFHHSVGAGPLRLQDRTEVISVDRPRQLVLRAHLSVLGSARVTIDVRDAGPHRAHLTMKESPASGVLRSLWRFGGRQALRLSLWGRNTESLQRLKDGIERGSIEGLDA